MGVSSAFCSESTRYRWRITLSYCYQSQLLILKYTFMHFRLVGAVIHKVTKEEYVQKVCCISHLNSPVYTNLAALHPSSSRRPVVTTHGHGPSVHQSPSSPCGSTSHPEASAPSSPYRAYIRAVRLFASSSGPSSRAPGAGHTSSL